jgi:hypothetical protein
VDITELVLTQHHEQPRRSARTWSTSAGTPARGIPPQDEDPDTYVAEHS